MLRNYFISAIRHLTKNPSHTFINIFGLGIGIACALLIATWVRHELSFDLFHKDNALIHQVLTNYKPTDGEIQTQDIAPRKFADFVRASMPEIEEVTQVATGTRWPYILCFKREKETSDACAYLNAVYVDSSFFNVFTFELVSGNITVKDEPFKVVITESKAKDLFPNQDPIGKKLVIDTWIETKVGAVVKDPPVNSTLDFDVLLSLRTFRMLRGLKTEEDWDTQWFKTYIKTIPTVTSASLNKKLKDESQKSEEAKEAGIEFFAQPLKDVHLYGSFKDGKPVGGRIEYVRIFGIIGIIVLAIACINFVNLATARATTRSKEIGVRKVSGAHRRNLIFQFMTEAFVVVLLSYIVGVAIAQLVLPVFNEVAGESLALHLFSGNEMYWMIGTLLLITIISGLYPALILSSMMPTAALKSKATERSGALSLRRILTVTQLAASITLILYTCVIFSQINLIQHKNLGYDHENIIRIEPTYNLLLKYDAFKSELLKNPKIENVTLSSADPLNIDFANDNVSWPGKIENEKIPFQMIASGYDFVETLNMQLLEGHTFSKGMPESPIPVLLTESALKKMNLSDPIGQRIKVFSEDAEIIGIVKDIHGQSLHHEVQPIIILLNPKAEQLTSILVRYKPGSTNESLSVIENIYNSLEQKFSMVYWFMDDTFEKQYKSELVSSNLTVFFTVITIGIAMLGILGLSTFNVIRRTREIGVRKVFGASVINILALISREFVLMVLASAIVAFPIAYYASSEWLARFAYHIKVPLWAFPISLIAILVITLIVICSQILKAALTNPTRILRHE